MSTQITMITEDMKQVFRLTISAKKYIDVSVFYCLQQSGWFMSFDYDTFSIKNLRIVNSGNFLHQFRNILPFGMSCITTDGQEPMFIKDFTSGRALLYYLNSSEVEAYAEVVSGQATA